MYQFQWQPQSRAFLFQQQQQFFYTLFAWNQPSENNHLPISNFYSPSQSGLCYVLVRSTKRIRCLQNSSSEITSSLSYRRVPVLWKMQNWQKKRNKSVSCFQNRLYYLLSIYTSCYSFPVVHMGVCSAGRSLKRDYVSAPPMSTISSPASLSSLRILN